MKMHAREFRLSDWRTLSLAAFVLLVAWIAFRNAGLYPVVFSDEYTYSMNSRLKPFSEAAIPSYLMFGFYRSTLFCGDGFLACARLLNLLLFAAATPFIWLVARRVTTPAIATWIALLAMASPCNVYTAVFIAESFYYFGFWAVVWFATCCTSIAALRYWIGLGFLVGLLSLIKPHALFLLPALMIYGAVASSAMRTERLRVVLAHLLVFLVVFFATKLGGGYCFAGLRGITLFGSYYGSATAPLELGSGAHWRLALITWFSLQGHVMALALLFAPAIAVCCSMLAATHRSSPDDPQWRLCLLTFLTVASLVAMTTIFTATVVGAGPAETEQRVHMRYYDFAFPLLMMVGAIVLTTPLRLRVSARVVTFVLAALVLYVGFKGFRDYLPSLIDAPELRAVGLHPTTRRETSLFALVGLGLLVWRPRYAALYFVFALMPWLDWKGTQSSLDLIEDRAEADVYDKAGLFARHFLPRDQASHVRVIGDDGAGVYRALFHLDDAKATWTFSTPLQPITSTMLAPPHEWALVVGDHPLEGSDLSSVSAGDATLVWKATSSGHGAPR